MAAALVYELFGLFFVLTLVHNEGVCLPLHVICLAQDVKEVPALHPFFYAGLSKEVSATGIFLGQGSSSCAKTLLK